MYVLIMIILIVLAIQYWWMFLLLVGKAFDTKREYNLNMIPFYPIVSIGKHIIRCWKELK